MADNIQNKVWHVSFWWIIFRIRLRMFLFLVDNIQNKASHVSFFGENIQNKASHVSFWGRILRIRLCPSCHLNHWYCLLWFPKEETKFEIAVCCKF